MIPCFPFMAKPLTWVFHACCLHSSSCIPSLIPYNLASSSAHSRVTSGFLTGLWPWSLSPFGSLKFHWTADIVDYSIWRHFGFSGNMIPSLAILSGLCPFFFLFWEFCSSVNIKKLAWHTADPVWWLVFKCLPPLLNCHDTVRSSFLLKQLVHFLAQSVCSVCVSLIDQMTV